MKNLFLSILLVCISGTALLAQDEPSTEPKQEEVKNLTEAGKKIPLFSIKGTDGSEFKLEEHKGKVVVLYFWATWCPYCRDEMPHLESEIWQKYGSSSDFAMIGIAWKQTEDDIANYLKTRSLTFPMAADRKGDVFSLFANRGVPRCYLIGRKGNILRQDVGFYPEKFAEWQVLIDKEFAKIEKDRTAPQVR